MGVGSLLPASKSKAGRLQPPPKVYKRIKIRVKGRDKQIAAAAH
jgi:hypothetical protein